MTGMLFEQMTIFNALSIKSLCFLESNAVIYNR